MLVTEHGDHKEKVKPIWHIKIKNGFTVQDPINKRHKTDQGKIFTTYKLNKGVNILTIWRLSIDLPENATTQIKKHKTMTGKFTKEIRSGSKSMKGK